MTTNQTGRGAADYLLASKRCEILGLEQLLQMGQLVACISQLVHVLQLERGASNMFVGSGGERCADIRKAQIKKAGVAERKFRDYLSGMDIDCQCTSGDSRLLSRVAYALHALDELGEVRREINQLKAVPGTIIDGYSALIQSLLAIVYETADSAADPEVSRLLVAMFHLMQGKEVAGQERAVGSAGFAQGRFDRNFTQRLRRLIDSQERCFQIFLNFSDETYVEQWQAIADSPSSVALERLRRIAFTSVVDGQADRDLSDAWFALTSERIDAMKCIEEAIGSQLSALCRDKVEHARADLDSHRLHLDTLSRKADQPSFAVFFNGNAACAIDNRDNETFETGCAGPQLGRSLFDLVHTQSERLQSMAEELEAARAALAERKTIEKAKGLIMTSRRVSEDEAYRFLRHVAMTQNRRLSDVARDTLAMAELLPSH